MNDHLKAKAADATFIENVDGLAEHLLYDAGEKKLYRELIQDVEPWLDHVKALRLEYGAKAGSSKSGDIKHAGSFPPVIVEGWLNARGLSMVDFKHDVVRDFLNDSANAAFRVWPGQV